jgi:menaquinone-dependent protoporphyrinogen oxidase
MTILVAFATRHGSTRCIAETIAAELEILGHDTVFADVANVPSLDRFDAAVVGSGVYVGQWLPAARQFVSGHREELARMPVWLFSSGPIGGQPTGTPPGVESIALGIGAQGHETFAGCLSVPTLGLGERMIAKVMHAPSGDFRDWETIRGWTRDIGATLATQPMAQAAV